MKALFALSALVLAIILAPVAHAQAPGTISFQGSATSQRGEPIADGTYDIEIALHDAERDGQTVYVEAQTARVTRGVFSIEIGSRKPFPASLRFDRQYWLDFSIDGGDRFEPRIALTAVPYALSASQAVSLSPTSTNGVHSINCTHGPIEIRGSGATDVRMQGNV
ncbi:MAG: hypothetical protein H7X80_02350, partial [bacterium]|nr:hypothetical protein [Candidatus Kapabacteria bacterium]